MHARLARYTTSAAPQELVRRAEEGMLPIFQAQPGFRAYSLIESDGELISFSAWDSPAQAEAANASAASWVAENMGSEITLTEARVGEVLLSTTLGIAAAAGVSA